LRPFGQVAYFIFFAGKALFDRHSDLKLPFFHQRRFLGGGKMENFRPTVIDLFCGGGGFGLGAELAGFRTLAAVDIDETLQSAYRLNLPSTKTIVSDVAILDDPAWSYLIGSYRPDGVIGGPPCQGFSRIGKRQKDDPRNTLIGHFFKQVEILRPKFFVMENVEGLLDKGNVDIFMGALEKVSSLYTVLDPAVVNAADFGAPTNRKRVVVVGYDSSCLDPIGLSEIIPMPNKIETTVRDAIADLAKPIPETKIENDFGWNRYKRKTRRPLSPYAEMQRKAPPKGLGWDYALAKHEQGKLSGFFETRHSDAVIDRFSAVVQGGVDSVSRYPRLSWEGRCPTLRAGTGSDRGSFQAMRPIHPSEPRVITVREAARLQGFPDWFVFHPAKWHSFRMIGNSVSPIVSHSILETIHTKFRRRIAA